jgi:hypothetical protein
LGFGAKLSQYEFAGGSACVITPDGAWHAVFQEESDFGKPSFIFHRISRDGGATWSAPENISIDNKGSGGGFPKLACDAQGNVYAAWVQFHGAATSLLDGPGGYSPGNLTLRRWSNGQWAAPAILGTPGKVYSFCLFTGVDGTPQVLWEDQGGIIATAPAAGGAAKVVATAGVIPGSNGFQFGRNLSALAANDGSVSFLAERSQDNSQQLFLWAGGQARALLSDPKFSTRNTFNSPAQMFADPNGDVHVICQPHPQTTERNELWDIDAITGTHKVIFKTSNGGELIQAFQLASRNGKAYVVMEWSAKPVADSTELIALSFDGAGWSAPQGLTGNARAEKFSYKETSLATGVGVGTSYHAKHASIALDAQGRPHLLGTISAYSVFGLNGLVSHSGTIYRTTTTGSVAHPSLYVISGNW